MKITFIRHGATKGNLEKRYIGKTDEELCPEGISELKKLDITQSEVIIVSPMKRCIQTAELLFPASKYIVYRELRECDFGRFEGKNYIELTGDAEYQAWIDSGGKKCFPDGESPEIFKQRCISAFEDIVKKYNDKKSMAFVVHGGTIMSILEKYGYPERDYYDWNVKNGHGWTGDFDGRRINISEKI